MRGALNVELLNRILRSLGKWTVPVIMIPGNHDQVTLGGAVHSLEPLQVTRKCHNFEPKCSSRFDSISTCPQYAFSKDQILLISEPSVCLGALWIPYRRDPEIMKAVLQAGRERQDIHTVFCHADVQVIYHINDKTVPDKTVPGLSHHN